MKSDFEALYHQYEQKHFWFKARRNYIKTLLKSHSRQSDIVDVGCSSGILLTELLQNGYNKENLYGLDISEKAINNCKENGIENAFVGDAKNLHSLNKKFNVIIASDCLEHIEDDTTALENWHTSLKENGALLVFVPAFMSLWSAHDKANMHFRRYTKKELKQKLISAGFTIEKASYWNTFLFFPVWLIRIFGNIFKSTWKEVSGDIQKPSGLNAILIMLLNFENRLLRKINFPVGVSTFCIAKKKSATHSEKLNS